MKVRLSEFSENWSLMYQEEVQFLSRIFDKNILRFEHFGSTSVEGLKAKPVIDMMCIVRDIDQVDSFNGVMEELYKEKKGRTDEYHK